MRITFEMEGGFACFPGLNRPLIIDTQQMEAAQALQIESMIKNARFFELPPHVGSPASGAADYQTYIVTVEEGQRSHVVRACDPIGNTALQELVEHLRARSMKSVKE